MFVFAALLTSMRRFLCLSRLPQRRPHGAAQLQGRVGVLLVCACAVHSLYGSAYSERSRANLKTGV